MTTNQQTAARRYRNNQVRLALGGNPDQLISSYRNVIYLCEALNHGVKSDVAQPEMITRMLIGNIFLANLDVFLPL